MYIYIYIHIYIYISFVLGGGARVCGAPPATGGLRAQHVGERVPVGPVHVVPRSIIISVRMNQITVNHN